MSWEEEAGILGAAVEGGHLRNLFLKQPGTRRLVTSIAGSDDAFRLSFGHHEVFFHAAMEKTPAPFINAEHYAVMSIRRTAPGQAEVHDEDTDVFYIIDGEATFVTGGKVQGGRTTAPGETRATGIEGGQTHILKKGDVITIPNGTPHWFSAVKSSVTYFVVKVR